MNVEMLIIKRDDYKNSPFLHEVNSALETIRWDGSVITNDQVVADNEGRMRDELANEIHDLVMTQNEVACRRDKALK